MRTFSSLVRVFTPAAMLTLATSALTAGCDAGKLDGNISGEPVPAFTSAMVTSTTTGDDKAFGVAIFATFSDACGFYSEASKAQDDFGKLDELRRARTSAENWTLTVDFGRLALSEADDFHGDAVALDDTGDIDLAFEVCHQHGYPTEDAAETDCFGAAKGSATFTYQKDSAFDVSESKLALQDAAGTEIANVTFSGTAGNCAGAAKLLEQP